MRKVDDAYKAFHLRDEVDRLLQENKEEWKLTSMDNCVEKKIWNYN